MAKTPTVTIAEILQEVIKEDEERQFAKEGSESLFGFFMHRLEQEGYQLWTCEQSKLDDEREEYMKEFMFHYIHGSEKTIAPEALVQYADDWFQAFHINHHNYMADNKMKGPGND